MKKETPTLADSMIREWLKPVYARNNVDDRWLLRNVSEANKFVLDANMSSFMADLAYATISKNVGGNRRNVILDSMRRQARLPHKITWIEYDFMAKARRSVEQYGSMVDLRPGQSPDRCGWLCLQHPQLETAFMAVECASHTWEVRQGKLQRLLQPAPSVIAYTWRTDDGPPPWSNTDVEKSFMVMARAFIENEQRSVLMRPEAIVTGIYEYQSESVKVIKSPIYPANLLQKIWDTDKSFNPFKELAGDLRYLWAFLATLNDLPISISDVRASKGFVARGRYRKFVDHKIIHLHIPEKRYKRVAAQAIAIARRRAHPVRGHFRIDRNKPPSPICDHEWGPADEHSHLTCNICHGRKLYIHEHMRGDASLGIVTHDYEVHHERVD